MSDGLDWTVLRLEMRDLSPSKRKLLNIEISKWLGLAAASQRWMTWVSLSFVVAGLCVFAVQLHGSLPNHLIKSLGVVLFFLGVLLSSALNRRAREWRRAHPFAQWRADH